jgi:hypothetical protein
MTLLTASFKSSHGRYVGITDGEELGYQGRIDFCVITLVRSLMKAGNLVQMLPEWQ